MPELRHLRYFVAVAEELNFSRAAKRLRMAQPPLSVAIRQLEQEIGASLFSRTSREVTLTEAGEALLAGARRTMAEVDAAVTAARRAAAGELGRLRLGHYWSSRFETLPALGQAFHRRYPDVELLTEEIRNSRMPPALRSGALDVAIAIYPEIVGELTYQLIRSEPIVVVLAAGHPLAGEPSVGLDALAEEYLLFPRDFAPRHHDFIVSLCRSAGFEPKQGDDSARSRWTTGTWDESTTALFPSSVSRHLPPGLVAVPIDPPTDPFEIYIMWRSDGASATVTAFVEVATQVYAAAG